jgi:hypothetical protein
MPLGRISPDLDMRSMGIGQTSLVPGAHPHRGMHLSPMRPMGITNTSLVAAAQRRCRGLEALSRHSSVVAAQRPGQARGARAAG